VQFPRFLKLLDAEFIEKMESLTEKSILSIIEAVTLLPAKSFKVGEEIRKVVIDNMVPEGDKTDQVDPGFFFDCIYRFTYGRRRRFSPTEVKKIFDYILAQVPFKDQINRTQEKLVRLIASENVQNLDSKKILDKILKNSESVHLDELELAINHELPVNNYLLRFYEQNKAKGLNPNKVVRLYTALTAVPQDNLP